MAQLWKYLAEALLGTFCIEGDFLSNVDDTLLHKTGRKVEGAGTFRDVVRSTPHKVVFAQLAATAEIRNAGKEKSQKKQLPRPVHGAIHWVNDTYRE